MESKQNYLKELKSEQKLEENGGKEKWWHRCDGISSSFPEKKIYTEEEIQNKYMKIKKKIIKSKTKQSGVVGLVNTEHIKRHLSSTFCYCEGQMFYDDCSRVSKEIIFILVWFLVAKRKKKLRFFFFLI